MLSCIVGGVAALVAGWTPTNDNAFIEMRVRDVPSHLPLLGVYSRFGWSHPGPAQFLWLAVPYRVLGSASAALLTGTLALHAAGVAIAWSVARRLDRSAGLLLLVACEVILLAGPADQVRSPWNPYVSLTVGAALVICGWGAAQRRGFATAVTLPIATLLVQSHAANLGLAIGVVGAAAAGAALGWRRSDEARAVPWRALAIGVASSLVLWVPPLIAQLTGAPGRISEMLSTGASVRRPVGAGQGFGVLLDSFSLLPSWARRSSFEAFAHTAWTVPVWLVVVLVGLAVAIRRDDLLAIRGIGVGLVATTSAALFTSLVTDGLFHYLVVGVRSAAAATLAIGLCAVIRGLPDHGVNTARWVLCTAAIGLGGALVVHQATGENPSQRAGRTVDELTAAVLARPEPSAGYRLVPEPTWINGSEALMLQLERNGRSVVVEDPSLRTAVGEHRMDDGHGDPEELTVTTAGNGPRLQADGWTVVAKSSDDHVEGAGTALIVAVRPSDEPGA